MKIALIKNFNYHNRANVSFKGEIEKEVKTDYIYAGEQEPGGYIETCEVFYIYHPYLNETKEQINENLKKDRSLSLGSRLPYDEDTKGLYEAIVYDRAISKKDVNLYRRVVKYPESVDSVVRSAFNKRIEDEKDAMNRLL